MVPKNIFSPWDLTDDGFQGDTHEQIHKEVKFMLGHRK